MKRERLIEAEIDEQNDMVALSLLEMVTSWEKGFREVNEMYGTDIHVELNPVLIREIADQFEVENEPIVEESTEETTATVVEESEETTVEETTEQEPEQEETVTENIDALEEVVEEVIDAIIDDEGEVEDDVEEPENSELLVPDTGDNT